MGFDTNDPGVNTVQENDLDTPFSDLNAVYGNPVKVGGGTDLQLDRGQSIQDDTGTSRVSINSSDVAISTADVSSFSTRPTFSSGIQVQNGQSLVDGSGTERLSVSGGFTSLKDDSGNNALVADDGIEVRLEARNGVPVEVRDSEGSFDAVTYSTSSTPPGKLSLDNAQLVANGDGVVGTRGGSAVEIGGNTNTQSLKVGFLDESGNQVHLFADNGDLKAQDTNGNVTTLT